MVRASTNHSEFSTKSNKVLILDTANRITVCLIDESVPEDFVGNVNQSAAPDIVSNVIRSRTPPVTGVANGCGRQNVIEAERPIGVAGTTRKS